MRTGLQNFYRRARREGQGFQMLSKHVSKLEVPPVEFSFLDIGKKGLTEESVCLACLIQVML